MVKIIYNKTIKELGNQISSYNETVPAGGTTAALNGYLAVSLFKLVFKASKNNLSKNDLEKIQINLNESEVQFLSLMNKDIEAYKLNNQLNFHNKKKLKKLIEIPLDIAETAFKIFQLTKKFENKIKNTVLADYKVALENIKSSKKGAVAIIKSNYQFFEKNSSFIKEIEKKLSCLE